MSELGIEKAKTLSTGHFYHVAYLDEVHQTIIGARKIVAINACECSVSARQACIDYHGYRCVVCGFDFESKYGERGKHFIHVHHIVSLATIGRSYAVDPIKDLHPICPNCHATIHQTNPPCSIDELMKMIRKEGAV
ncbi:HNH endonuclease [Burkholderia ubonensis]|uniref:HNH endonuclease n=1 Tax=Burkholderia ubonensis TaxID=101571 RepID=UPI0009B4103C|nr:HNH endonuclease [Burkholderia ubonensis]